MKTTSILIALAVAATVFSISLFAQPAGALTPPPDIFPVFAVLTVLESLAFGAGVAYVLQMRRRLFAGGFPPLQRAVAWAIAFLLLAPWPHDSLHRIADINGVMNWPFLAVIEFIFHLGIVPVGLIVGAYMLRAGQLREA